MFTNRFLSVLSTIMIATAGVMAFGTASDAYMIGCGRGYTAPGFTPSNPSASTTLGPSPTFSSSALSTLRTTNASSPSNAGPVLNVNRSPVVVWRPNSGPGTINAGASAVSPMTISLRGPTTFSAPSTAQTASSPMTARPAVPSTGLRGTAGLGGFSYPNAPNYVIVPSGSTYNSGQSDIIVPRGNMLLRIGNVR